jgi:two-component system cell cycle sensor histidine kinase/response regulator CckA
VTTLLNGASAPSDRLRELVSQLAAVQAEIEEVTGGQVDAVVDASSSLTLLLRGAQARLLHQEQEYRALVEHSPDLVARFDPGLRVMYANPATRRLLGAETEEDARGRTVMEITGARAGTAAWQAAIGDVVRTGRPREGEFLFQGEGGPVALSSRIHPQMGPDGRVESVLVVARDTTERHRAEAQVRESHAFLQSALDALSAHLAVVDPAGDIVAVNEAWRRFAAANGHTGSAEGGNYLRVCDAAGPHAPFAAEAAEGIRAVLAGRAPSFEMEYPCDAPEERRWFTMRVTPLQARGRPHAVVAHENTTARRLAQEERDGLIRALDRLAAERAAVLRQIGEGVMVADLEGRITFSNAEADRLLGLSQTGMPAHDPARAARLFTMDGEPLAPQDVPLVRAVRTGQEVPGFMMQVAHPDGTRLVVEGAANPVFEAGRRIGAVVSLRDVTARVMAEVEREELTVRESAARLAAEAARERVTRILESVTDAFFALDEEWRFTYLNPQAEPLLWRSRESLLGRVIWDEFPVAVGSTFEREYRRVVAERVPSTFEAFFPPLESWFEVHAYPAEDGISVYFRDISERRERERHAAALLERLAAERGLLEAVLRQLPVGVIIAEAPTGRLIMGNAQVDHIWRHGYLSSPSIAQYGEWEGFHPDGRRVQAHEWPLARALRTGENVADEEYAIVRADGVRGTARLSASPVRDARGKVVAGVVIIADVTEETAARRALHASEERYRLVSRATNDVIWDWDVASGHLQWNDAVTPVLGYPQAQIPADLEWWYGHIHPDDLPGVAARLEAVLAGTELAWSDEYRFRHAGGSWLRVFDRAYLLRDGAGRPVRMIGSMLDLTERTRAEEAIRFQALLLDAVEQAVIAYDVEGEVIAWNRFAARLYGRPAAEVLGRHWSEVFPDGGMERVMLESLGAAVRGESWSGEVELTRADGGRILVQAAHAPLRDGAGGTMGIVGVTSDVTERRSLEEQLRQSQKMEAVGKLAGGVAHDFNNVLTVIRGHADLLLAEVGGEDRIREDLRQISAAAQRAAALTGQLLAFSRRQVLQPRQLELNALVAGLLPMLTRLLGEDVRLEVRTDPAPLYVSADPGQLEQVLLNLSVNARDAISPGGHIRIETGDMVFDGSQAAWDGTPIPAGRYVVLSVGDTGEGMPPEVMSRAFEPFFTTKEPGQGTGLGLSTVYGIVKQSGGHLRAHSQVGEGSVFTAYLPRLDAVDPAPPPAPEAAEPAGGTETVLLVEDEEAVRRFARRVLTRAGYTVLEASEGVQAVEAARRFAGRIAVVVSDVVMPAMGGYATARELATVLPHTPVVFISGYTGEDVLRRGGLPPDAPFLQKPFTPAALLEQVRQAIDARAPD